MADGPVSDGVLQLVLLQTLRLRRLKDLYQLDETVKVLDTDHQIPPFEVNDLSQWTYLPQSLLNDHIGSLADVQGQAVALAVELLQEQRTTDALDSPLDHHADSIGQNIGLLH